MSHPGPFLHSWVGPFAGAEINSWFSRARNKARWMGRTRKLKSSPLSPSLSLSSPFKFEFMWAQEGREAPCRLEGRLPACPYFSSGRPRSLVFVVWCFLLLLLLLPSLEFLCYEKGETMTHNLKKGGMGSKNGEGENGPPPVSPISRKEFFLLFGLSGGGGGRLLFPRLPTHTNHQSSRRRRKGKDGGRGKNPVPLESAERKVLKPLYARCSSGEW